MKSKLEKLIIVLIFFAFFFGMIFLSDLPVFLGEFNNLDGSIFVMCFIYACLSSVLFIFVSLKLIPTFPNIRRLTRYFLFSIAIGIIGISIMRLIDSQVLRMFNLPTEANMVSDKMLMHPRHKTLNLPTVPVFLIVYILGVLYGMSRDWLKKTRQHEMLIKEKMLADIDFLRSQINPHFFFNSLNNIYAITLCNNDEETGKAILKLSAVMRYMVYESSVEKTSLDKEIENIENYIDIAKLKFPKNDQMKIDIHKAGSYNGIKIAPLLLIPFVENAVKHGLAPEKSCHIKLDIILENNSLNFRVENSVQNNQERIKKHSGIGLENVEKRLALLYSNRHSLKIKETGDRFMVELKLSLEE
jgi:two-component system, LytTR family, sensor kinase